MAQDEQQVQAEPREDERRDQKDVDDEEAAQRRPADGVAAEDEARDAARR